jgi:hypothetical protein
MSKKTNGVNWAKSPAHNHRRITVLKKLQKQLESNTKTSKDEHGKKVVIALTERDVSRIEKEIQTLKTRIHGG